MTGIEKRRGTESTDHYFHKQPIEIPLFPKDICHGKVAYEALWATSMYLYFR